MSAPLTFVITDVQPDERPAMSLVQPIHVIVDTELFQDPLIELRVLLPLPRGVWASRGAPPGPRGVARPVEVAARPRSRCGPRPVEVAAAGPA